MTIERIKEEIYSILRRLTLVEQRGSKVSPVAVDSNSTILASDSSNVYFVTCPSGNVSIILPSTSDVEGKTYTFKKLDAINTLNIQPIRRS